jgi:hypothetical protein
MASSDEFTLDMLKAVWNEILDLLLEADRIAWLAFFDARLVSLAPGVLTLNFSDVTKLSGDHNFSIARNPKHIALLREAIKKVTQLNVEIVEV